ncbi:MAG: hypothetical protein IPJ12_12485 [Betaproteobacteria bacterium]|nr:hypothetical protein [Betaproteobacteria bacterium]
MSISSVLSTGLQSMQAAINRTGIASSRIAADDSEMATNIVGLHQGAIDAKLAANVIKPVTKFSGQLSTSEARFAGGGSLRRLKYQF